MNRSAVESKRYRLARTVALGVLVKGIAILTSMMVSGIVTFYATGLSLFSWLGKPQDNYEANVLGALAFGAAFIGFLAPGVLAWYLDRRGYERAQKFVGTLALMLVSGIVPFFVACFILLEFEREIPGNLKRGLWLGAYCLPITGFLVSGVIVWYLRRKRTKRARSG